MEQLVLDILDVLRSRDSALAPDELEAIIRTHNQGIADNAQHHSKRRLVAYCVNVREHDEARWRSWNVDTALEERLMQTLRLKPRRTASGVATITVLTKPHACSGACLYCPNDVRMPKSYLADEPACQRAERSCFDPYLQVSARLSTLRGMGHPTDKIELIVLGGTWDDYPTDYRIWFIHELFRALNDASEGEAQAARSGSAASPAPDDAHTDDVSARRARYEHAGIASDAAVLREQAAPTQALVNAGELSYNQAIARLYGESDAWRATRTWQRTTMDDLQAQHARNERARHRAVGLVIETRPDAVTCENLAFLRACGCTKVQIGVQSLSDALLSGNHRGTDTAAMRDAFAWLRLFGFKIHAHFMANLYGATPRDDMADFHTLAHDARFLPDEVKLYPCALIDGTQLMRLWQHGKWAPYDESTLVDVLAECVADTPPFMRISRMIRDFSAGDIVAGTRKVNLREEVERKVRARAQASDRPVEEIRFRELNARRATPSELKLDDVAYRTSTGREHFLQWVAPDGTIAGFCRLSLPDERAVRAACAASEAFPIRPGEAMIREVHVYGRAAKLHETGSAQHLGLGRRLIARACDIARNAGYTSMNVISSVGTREYYRALGFEDAGLYQRTSLV